MKAYCVINRVSAYGKNLGPQLYAEQEWREYPAVHSEPHTQGHYLTDAELANRLLEVAKAAFEAGRATKETHQKSGNYSYNHHTSYLYKSVSDYVSVLIPTLAE